MALPFVLTRQCTPMHEDSTSLASTGEQGVPQPHVEAVAHAAVAPSPRRGGLGYIRKTHHLLFTTFCTFSSKKSKILESTDYLQKAMSPTFHVLRGFTFL